MLVRDIMTKDPLVAAVPGTRDAVLRLFVKHVVTGIPVVKEGTSTLAGIVTRSDVFRQPNERQLALIMTGDPVTIAQDASVEDAARLLHERGIHTLPVVDAAGALLGVVTPSDVLRVLGDAAEGHVKDYAQTLVVPVYEETPLPAVWEIMQLARQNALPVIDAHANVSGIVADSDLFKLSDVEDRIGKRELGLDPEDEEEWMLSNVRDIAPAYYATNVVDLPQKPVKDIMTRDVVSVFEGTSVGDAARKMVKHRVNQLPVVAANDRLAGLLTDLDLMRAAFTG